MYAEFFCILTTTALHPGSLNRKNFEKCVDSKGFMWLDNADSLQMNVYASRVLKEAYSTACLK